MEDVNKNFNPYTTLKDRLLGTMLFIDKEDIVKKKILNIGCGFGWFEVRAEKLGAKEIWGIEKSKKDLDVVKKIIKNKRVKFKVGDAINLPFEDNQFDTVVSWEVIEHIPANTEKLMFSEINRVLKKDGTLYISTPSSNFLTTILDPAWWIMGHRHYSIEKIRSLSDKFFRVSRFSIKGGLWNTLGLLNMYLSKWILRKDLVAKNYFSEKITAEYKQRTGFTNLFVKFKVK